MDVASAVLVIVFSSVALAQQTENRQQETPVRAGSLVCSGEKCIDTKIMDAQCGQPLVKSLQTIETQQARRACTVRILGGPVTKYKSWGIY
jgi:hypothetical protein